MTRKQAQIGVEVVVNDTHEIPGLRGRTGRIEKLGVRLAPHGHTAGVRLDKRVTLYWCYLDELDVAE